MQPAWKPSHGPAAGLSGPANPPPQGPGDGCLWWAALPPAWLEQQGKRPTRISPSFCSPGSLTGPPPSPELPASPGQAPEFKKQKLGVPASGYSWKREALVPKGRDQEYGFLGFRVRGGPEGRIICIQGSQLKSTHLPGRSTFLLFRILTALFLTSEAIKSLRLEASNRALTLLGPPWLPSSSPQQDGRDPRDGASPGQEPFCRCLAPCPWCRRRQAAKDSNHRMGSEMRQVCERSQPCSKSHSHSELRMLISKCGDKGASLTGPWAG